MDKAISNNKKTLLLIIIIITTIVSSTYAFLFFSTEENTVASEAGCFVVDYEATEITTSSLVSTSEIPTTPISQITIKKDATCEIYTQADIYIHTTSDSTTAPINTAKALKYKIIATSTNGSTIIDSTGEITTSTDSDGNVIEDLKIATVDITTEEITYDIYIWVDKNISQGAYNGKTYSGYIYAESTQSSTITQ